MSVSFPLTEQLSKIILDKNKISRKTGRITDEIIKTELPIRKTG